MTKDKKRKTRARAPQEWHVIDTKKIALVKALISKKAIFTEIRPRHEIQKINIFCKKFTLLMDELYLVTEIIDKKCEVKTQAAKKLDYTPETMKQPARPVNQISEFLWNSVFSSQGEANS